MKGYGMARYSIAARQTAFLASVAAVLVLLLAGREISGFQTPTPAELAAKNRQVEALVGQARQKLQRLEWDPAIADCNKALEVDPQSASALLDGFGNANHFSFTSAKPHNAFC